MIHGEKKDSLEGGKCYDSLGKKKEKEKAPGRMMKDCTLLLVTDTENGLGVEEGKRS